jgi:hypothetical protein
MVDIIEESEVCPRDGYNLFIALRMINMYKDKDKQREANKLHARAYRRRKNKLIGSEEGMTYGLTKKDDSVIIPINELFSE